MNGSLVSLNGLLTGNQVFDIPLYQRGYAWGRKNLEDLWEDLYYLDPSKKHYFGTVLLKDSGKTAETSLATLKRFDLIDGQQRLTTVLILLREIISQLKEVSASELRGDVNDLEKAYLKIGGHYKLNPLGEDGAFFHRVIDGHDDDTTTNAQQRLEEARAFFGERLVGEKEQRPSEYQNFLVGLKQKIDDLQLIQYQVSSDADAIRIFESVNDRGRPLSNLEKTKSFLMHTSYLGIEDDDAVAGTLKELNGHFSSIYRHFEGVSGTRHLERLRMDEDDVQRYHFINYVSSGKDSSRPTASLKVLIRDKLRNNSEECVEYAIAYAQDLEGSFRAVKQITEAYKEDDEGKMLSKVFMLERMGNIFPLLIASWLRFGDGSQRLNRILNLLEAFIVRVYLVGAYRSNTGASWLNGLAHRVHSKGLEYDSVVGELRKMNHYYQSDDRFRRALRQGDLYRRLSSRTLRYLLSEYEIHLRKNGDVPLAVSIHEKILSSEYEVEHIWAQQPSYEMETEEETEHRQNVHRLGNLTIASQSWNKSMGNKTFQEKQHQPGANPSYSNSNLRVQRDLARLPSWNVQAINDREADIVSFALQRWSL
ncbi:MAG: DUF262 domain-containing protein [Acidimicrobiia bacterium]|nr:DUF262 domain-containing protein [Acidimicrobiia bacterium]